MGKFSKWMAVTCMSMAALAGCSSNDAGSAGGGDVIKIGVNYEQSGSAATYGTSHVEGIKLAVKEINDAGGVDVGGTKKKIELDIKDNKSDGTELPVAYNSLVENGNVVILGPAVSSLTKQAFTLASEAKVPTLSASATADDATLTQDGSVQPYGFKTCYSDEQQGTAIAKAAIDKGFKNVVIYSDSSSDYAKGLSKVFKETFTAAGGTVVDEQNYVEKDKDFSSVLTKIKGEEFDAIFVPGYYEEASQIIKQAREMGIDKPIVGPDGFDSPKLKEVVGADNLSNVFFTTHFSTKEDSQKVKDFIAAYKKEYGKESDTFGALGYDLAYFVKDCIEKAGSDDPEKIKDAIASAKDFVGVTGKFSMSENHTPIKSIKFVELTKGEQSSAKEINLD